MQSIHKTINTKSRRICSVFGCSTYCTKEVSLHSFPTDAKLREAWKTALRIGKPISKYMQVCSLHFTENDFTITSRQATSKLRRLKKRVIPSRNIPNSMSPDREVVSEKSQERTLDNMSEAEESIKEVEEEMDIIDNERDDYGSEVDDDQATLDAQNVTQKSSTSQTHSKLQKFIKNYLDR